MNHLPLPASARAALAAVVLAAATTPAVAQDAGRMLGGLLRSLNSGTLLQPPADVAGDVPANDLVRLLGDATDTIDEAREQEIGRQLAAILLGSKPLHGEAALQRYVNRLGRWISLHSPRPHLPWNFAVLDDPGFNAFAAPGGYVFVTKGLVDRVEESELAAILAHEIVHVSKRHHIQALRAKARAGLATQLLASQLRSNTAGALSAQMLALGKDLYGSGLDQGDEFEADREGVVLAVRAGFDPYGLPSVIQQLRSAAPDNPLFSLALATHPPAQQRLDALESAMGTRLDAHAGKPPVSVAQRVRGK